MSKVIDSRDNNNLLFQLEYFGIFLFYCVPDQPEQFVEPGPIHAGRKAWRVHEPHLILNDG